MKKLLLSILVLFIVCSAFSVDTIVNGVPWYDQKGDIVNTHGSGIIYYGNRYWMFGEYKSDTTNAFSGFGCYSSTDLMNWRFERIVLPRQKVGLLGPNCVGERVKVMRCPKTGEFVMFFHADAMDYRDPNIVVAVSKKVNGNYHILGTITYQNKAVKRWDMGVFQDTDGKGYLLIHHGPIYQLSDDYHSIVKEVAHVNGMGESPAMFKRNGTYYLLTSNTTGWERNDNYYYTAPTIGGPWTKRGLFCPEGTLTYNTQCTYVLPVNVAGNTILMYMGDRWAYPYQGSAATNVWLPIQVEGQKLSIPEYWQSWSPKTIKPVDILSNTTCIYDRTWDACQRDSQLVVHFTGRQAVIVSKTNCYGGFGRVTIWSQKGKKMFSSVIEFYSKVDDESIRIITPLMKRSCYTLVIEPLGTMFRWIGKKGNVSGALDCKVRVDRIYIR